MAVELADGSVKAEAGTETSGKPVKKKAPGGPMYVVVGKVIGLDTGRYTLKELEGFDVEFLTRSNHIILEEGE